jgi:endonuclease/exonuclease/phosphatase family metal-dependent hydrolase
MSDTITVATLNLLNDQTRWDERRGMIVDGFRRHQPDLIALQEVVLPANTAEWLAAELGGYDVFLTRKTGVKVSQHEGIAILSRLPVDQSQWLDLQSQHRVAQACRVSINGHALLFVNCHLYWSINDHIERLRQIERLQAWVSGQSRRQRGMGVVICGDFNGAPDSRAIAQMRRHYRSAYAIAHGREPYWTCPTPLQFSTQFWRRVLMNLAGRVVKRTNDYWRSTLDYVFVNDRVRVREAHVTFTQHAPHDRMLYPSDHLGLVSTLSLKRAQPSQKR